MIKRIVLLKLHESTISADRLADFTAKTIAFFGEIPHTIRPCFANIGGGI